MCLFVLLDKVVPEGWAVTAQPSGTTLLINGIITSITVAVCPNCGGYSIDVSKCCRCRKPIKNGVKLMPDPDYAPIQEKNCENKQGGDTTSPHLSKKGNMIFSKIFGGRGTKCENCQAMVLPEALSLHNGICNNFKMI